YCDIDHLGFFRFDRSSFPYTLSRVSRILRPTPADAAREYAHFPLRSGGSFRQGRALLFPPLLSSCVALKARPCRALCPSSTQFRHWLSPPSPPLFASFPAD